MKTCIHETNGAVCAQPIEVSVDEVTGTVADVVFYGGCPGNHAGITALVRGMSVAEAVRRLSGIRCGNRSSSCPDQLAEALKKVLK